jgi:hypothetical protein
MMRKVRASDAVGLLAVAIVLAWAFWQSPIHAQSLPQEKQAASARRATVANLSDDSPRNVLNDQEWQQVDSAVDRALAFLADQQQVDGSFPTLDYAQPAVTSLCVMAFMAHGHTPGHGRYGKRLDEAVKFVTACQKQNGLLMLVGPDELSINRNLEHSIGVAGSYDHAISGLMLSELYGMNSAKNVPGLKDAINKALYASLTMQRWSKQRPEDTGGWRYINQYGENDSDLSVTGWELMFMRSARNAGFSVPPQVISDAIAYIRRTYRDDVGTFNYTTGRNDVRSRGMAGAGILALGHAGFHNSAEAKRTAETLLGYSFEVYNDSPFPKRDRYHYSLFVCCQGMYQMGSPYWEKFFPRTVRAVLTHQNPDGSWDAESFQRDRKFGNAYTTAMVILAVGAPNQLLPIFQR